jgi:hypothetical protein
MELLVHLFFPVNEYLPQTIALKIINLYGFDDEITDYLIYYAVCSISDSFNIPMKKKETVYPMNTWYAAISPEVNGGF